VTRFNVKGVNTTSSPPFTDDVYKLASFLKDRRVLVLSGAGISTESGIPDYRGPQSAGRPRNPMRYQEFVGSEAARRRYWARSAVGWEAVQRAQPNAGHKALTHLETKGILNGILTQNVDGLHQKAGSRNVLELHGSLAAVRCLRCGGVGSRRQMQRRLRDLNPMFEGERAEVAPDGDADLPQRLVDAFKIPSCLSCGGVLKPDVVFFGENVPGARVARAWEMLARAQVLLVVGSSLSVRSGYRFVVGAVQDGKPVVIVNDGLTRGDGEASLRVSGRLGELLSPLTALLT